VVDIGGRCGEMVRERRRPRVGEEGGLAGGGRGIRCVVDRVREEVDG
jgi:hypothetical protein